MVTLKYCLHISLRFPTDSRRLLTDCPQVTLRLPIETSLDSSQNIRVLNFRFMYISYYSNVLSRVIINQSSCWFDFKTPRWRKKHYVLTIFFKVPKIAASIPDSIFYDDIMIFLPEHFSPSPSNPVLQMHLWDLVKQMTFRWKITLRFDIIYHCTLSLNVNSLSGTNTRSDYTWLSGSGKSNLNEPGIPKYCSKISQRLLEDCPQIAQRLPPNCPQIAHGLPTACPQIAHSLHTECLWISFGLPTWYLLITYELIDRGMLIADGLLTDCSLIAHWLLTDCSLIAHWLLTDCSRIAQGLLKNCSRASPRF